MVIDTTSNDFEITTLPTSQDVISSIVNNDTKNPTTFLDQHSLTSSFSSPQFNSYQQLFAQQQQRTITNNSNIAAINGNTSPLTTITSTQQQSSPPSDNEVILNQQIAAAQFQHTNNIQNSNLSSSCNNNSNNLPTQTQIQPHILPSTTTELDLVGKYILLLIAKEQKAKQDAAALMQLKQQQQLLMSSGAFQQQQFLPQPTTQQYQNQHISIPTSSENNNNIIPILRNKSHSSKTGNSNETSTKNIPSKNSFSNRSQKSELNKVTPATNSKTISTLPNPTAGAINVIPINLATTSISQASLEQAIPSSRYKTELCRPFEESGFCKYGDKCQFAHGMAELRTLARHPKYKSEFCRTYHTSGFCPYGPRCHFVHDEDVEKLAEIKTKQQQHAVSQQLSNAALVALASQTQMPAAPIISVDSTQYPQRVSTTVIQPNVQNTKVGETIQQVFTPSKLTPPTLQSYVTAATTTQNLSRHIMQKDATTTISQKQQHFILGHQQQAISASTGTNNVSYSAPPVPPNKLHLPLNSPLSLNSTGDSPRSSIPGSPLSLSPTNSLESSSSGYASAAEFPPEIFNHPRNTLTTTQQASVISPTNSEMSELQKALSMLSLNEASKLSKTGQQQHLSMPVCNHVNNTALEVNNQIFFNNNDISPSKETNESSFIHSGQSIVHQNFNTMMGVSNIGFDRNFNRLNFQ